MPLTSDRNTPRRDGVEFNLGVAAATTCYAGGIAVRNANGYAAPGSTATGLLALGRFEETVINAGANGAKSISIRAGVFQWANSAAADAITIAEVGQVCYIVDDQTVAKTDGGGTRSPAGIIHDVDSKGVWVRCGQDALINLGLLAANNLSDLGNKNTARANVGGGTDKIIVELRDIDMVGANAQVKRVVSPVAGDIAKIYSVIDGALTTGDATLTAKIGAVAVTNGAITVTQAGSAAGDVDVATPTAAKTVAVGNVISITVGGTNDAAVLGHVLIVITPSA